MSVHRKTKTFLSSEVSLGMQNVREEIPGADDSEHYAAVLEYMFE